MTAEEKAWEFINLYRLDDTFGEVDFYEAVHCATILVGQLIEYDHLRLSWWKQVKEELDKL